MKITSKIMWVKRGKKPGELFEMIGTEEMEEAVAKLNLQLREKRRKKTRRANMDKTQRRL